MGWAEVQWQNWWVVTKVESDEWLIDEVQLEYYGQGSENTHTLGKCKTHSVGIFSSGKGSIFGKL